MKRLIMFISIVSALLIGLTTAYAQHNTVPAAADSAYDLSWYTVDGGGVTFSSGGSYSLGGSIGQADAGTLSRGAYALNGGFWDGASSANYSIYLPLVAKNF